MRWRTRAFPPQPEEQIVSLIGRKIQETGSRFQNVWFARVAQAARLCGQLGGGVNQIAHRRAGHRRTACATRAAKKAAPFLGPPFKEARGRKSGTAIEGRCLLRKQLLSRVGYTERRGLSSSVCGLFSCCHEIALARPKLAAKCWPRLSLGKSLSLRDLQLFDGQRTRSDTFCQVAELCTVAALFRT